MLELISLTPQKYTSYQDALLLQEELAKEGRFGFLFFTPPPTITLGLRSDVKDILFLDKDHQYDVLKVNRGGLTTYHGPGQVVIFPFGKLEQFVGDSRAVRIFIEKIQNNLTRYYLRTNVLVKSVASKSPVDQTAGLWAFEDGTYKKFASFGLRFDRNGISHGIALNLFKTESLVQGFKSIIACGDLNAVVGFVFKNHLELGEVQKCVEILKMDIFSNQEEQIYEQSL